MHIEYVELVLGHFCEMLTRKDNAIVARHTRKTKANRSGLTFQTANCWLGVPWPYVKYLDYYILKQCNNDKSDYPFAFCKTRQRPITPPSDHHALGLTDHKSPVVHDEMPMKHLLFCFQTCHTCENKCWVARMINVEEHFKHIILGQHWDMLASTQFGESFKLADCVDWTQPCKPLTFIPLCAVFSLREHCFPLGGLLFMRKKILVFRLGLVLDSLLQELTFKNSSG